VLEILCREFAAGIAVQFPGKGPLYILRTSLRGQFMYLTVSMRLTILAVTCIGSAELNALPTDCCRISSLRLTTCCCPTRETLILSGGFRNFFSTGTELRREILPRDLFFEISGGTR
jgi:hypothetical protein